MALQTYIPLNLYVLMWVDFQITFSAFELNVWLHEITFSVVPEEI